MFEFKIIAHVASLYLFLFGCLSFKIQRDPVKTEYMVAEFLQKRNKSSFFKARESKIHRLTAINSPPSTENHSYKTVIHNFAIHTIQKIENARKVILTKLTIQDRSSLSVFSLIGHPKILNSLGRYSKQIL